MMSNYNFSSLVDLLCNRALHQPDQIAFTFLKDGETEEISLTYWELDQQARAIAAQLQNLGSTRENALLLYPPGLEFIAAFFGCLYVGVVAVPAYPPRYNQNLSRLQAIVSDAQASVALTTASLLTNIKGRFAQNSELAGLCWLATDNIASDLASDWQKPEVNSDTLAFLQYTSGSTGTPKGVMVSHGNLLHNLALIHKCFEHTLNSRGVIWLPPYHDMGLIGGVLQPLYGRCPVTLMSPVAFLQKPFRWLQAISRFKATTSGGPNFAYELACRKITPEQISSLDLSSWEVAFTGSEPVRAETLERFAAIFEPCGFRREAFFPCYGLAEATLIVSGGLKTAPPVLCQVSGAALEQNRVVVAIGEEDNARALVSCGQAWLDQKIVIVNPEFLTPRPANQVGEIWVSSASLAQGYWNRPEETKQTFHAYLADMGVSEVGRSPGPFLRTGDLGFLQDGELFVTGRLKDLIIIRGRNHYPQDIELTVKQSHPALRPDCCAVFSVDVDGEERLVVVQEVERHSLRNLNIKEIVGTIRQAVAEQHDLQVYALILLKTNKIPKTSSGKIQRYACRSGFLAGILDEVGRSVLEDWDDVGSKVRLTREGFLAMAPEERLPRLVDYLREQVLKGLKVAPSQMDSQQPLSQLGLDSLMAVELKHQLEADLGVVVSMVDFLQETSVVQLATQVLAQLKDSSSHLSTAIVPASEQVAEFPLSHGQQALWFLHQLAPESAAYNVFFAVRILSDLDVAALKQTFQMLSIRHPALRTTFTALNGQPRQRIQEQLEVAFEETDASIWTLDELNDRLVESAHRPFDLEQGPLMRVGLFRRGVGEHILLLAVHHIVIDLWSLVVLMDELRILYPTLKAGRPVSLPPLDWQYAEYVCWQSDMLASSEGEWLWSYWQKQLAGELPVLNLPTDRPRTSVQTYRGAAQTFKLDEKLTGRLKTLAQAEGATLYMLLLAAFHVLLYRYTGQEDILVGSPAAGRSRAELAGMVGYLVNPVVLRVDLSGNPTFKGFLDQVRQTVLGALEHQDYPFPLLVEQLQQSRDSSYSPLFQVMFVLEKPHQVEELAPFVLGETGIWMDFGGLETESLALEQQVAQFDLTLMMVEVEGELGGSWQYNTDLFDGATISRLVGHFQTLLEGIVAVPEQCLSDLPLLTAAERRQLLVEWNDTQVDYRQEVCVHQLFEAQVERTPDAVAVVFEDQQLTYRELNHRANCLAHHLQALGVGPEVLVGICVERSLEMVVGLLGILKAGGAYMPLDPRYPKERLAYMLSDSQVPVLLTTEKLVGGLPEHRASVVCLNTDWEVISPDEEKLVGGHAWAPVQVKPENLAYVIYTSGSTGKPKGVLVTHQGLCNLAEAQRKTFDVHSDSRVLQFASFSFDASVWEVVMALCSGARLCLGTPDSLLPGQNLMQMLRNQAITHVTLPPSALAVLPAEELPAWRTIIVAGEACAPDLITQWSKGRRFFNAYGPTESTVCATVAECTSGSGQPPIGRPIANTQIYILDPHLQAVPIGVPGELHIGGAGLARGYLNRTDLTDEKFIPNPFCDAPGERLYKTGDLGRYLPDGNIEFLGRTDYQVKVRGFRIELGEIEAILSQHPSVQEVVVIARNETQVSGSKFLAAYVVPSPHQQLSPSELSRFLKSKLPDYMVPSVFILLETLPLTPNGKVDRQALLIPDRVRLKAEKTITAPRTPVEELLAEIWTKLLGADSVGIHDNFFELGGHSLLAAQLISRLCETFQMELSLHHLFEVPTIAELAQYIETNRWAGQSLQVPPLQPISRHRNLPLSLSQQRSSSFQQFSSPLSHIPTAVYLTGTLNIVALEQSLNEIIRRHEVFRTVFVNVEYQPEQAVIPELTLPLPVIDLSKLAENEREAETQRLVIEGVLRPFDLTQGPLLRSTLVQLSAQEYVWLLTIHHMIFDGWSAGIFFREVAVLYEAFSTGKPSPLPKLPIQYADFAHWQQQWMQGEVLQVHLDYWKKQLGRTPQPLKLPTIQPSSLVKSSRGATQSFVVPTTLTDKLKILSHREGVTLFLSLLAILKTLLFCYTGQENIMVGSPVAGRNRVETEGLIGFFTNMLPLYTDLSGNPTFRELLSRVREVVLGAHAHQNLPFSKIKQILHLESEQNSVPLISVRFAFQNFPIPTPTFSGLEVRQIHIDTELAKGDLTLFMHERDHQMIGTLEYNCDLFSSSTIAQMIDSFQTLMEIVVVEPEQRLLEFRHKKLNIVTSGR